MEISEVIKQALSRSVSVLKSKLAKVALSGKFSDLTEKPTAEDVGAVSKDGGTLTGSITAPGLISSNGLDVKGNTIIGNDLVMRDGPTITDIIRFRDDGDGDVLYGGELIITGAGNTYVGSGESPRGLQELTAANSAIPALNKTIGRTSEELIISSDNSINFISSCANDGSGGKGMVFTSSGNLIPSINKGCNLGAQFNLWNTIWGAHEYLYGTLQLFRTTDAAAAADNRPALIIGGDTGERLEFDVNEIMAKSGPTGVGTLYLQNDGGICSIGANQYFQVQDTRVKISNNPLCLLRNVDIGTADNIPALIIGGEDTATHIAIDADEIQAYGANKAKSTLNLNHRGGNVNIKVDNLVVRDNDVRINKPLLIAKSQTVTGTMSGTSGTAGWIVAAQIVVKTTYVNHTIEFEIGGRGRGISAHLSILFESVNNTDPTVTHVQVWGNENATSYIRVKKTATSTWQIAVQKSEAYGNVTIFRTNAVQQVSNIDGAIAITYPGTQMATAPDSTWTTPSWGGVIGLAERAIELNSPSSRRYKKNVKNITDEKARKLLSTEIYSFEYKEDQPSKGTQYGVIAEEVVENFEDVVIFGSDGKPDAVNYVKFVPHLIKMIQVQQEQLDFQNDEIQGFKRENEELRTNFASLEKRIRKMEECLNL